MVKHPENLYLVLVFIALALICQKQVNAGKTQNSLPNLCASGKDFWETYRRSCGDGRNDNVDYITRAKGKPNTQPTGGSKPPTPGTGSSRPLTFDAQTIVRCLVFQCATGQNCSLPAARGKRFMSAEDIPEADQENRIAKVRDLNRMDQNNLCTAGQDAHIDKLINSLHRVLNYFDTLRDMKVNFPLLASRTIEGQIATTLEKIKFGPGQSTLLNKLQTLQEASKNISMKLEAFNDKTWNWLDRVLSTTYFLKMPNSRYSWKDRAILANKGRHPVSHFQDLLKYHAHHEANNECYLDMIQDCGLSQECADLLMDKSAKLTTLGHNLMFFRMAVQMECVTEVDFVNKFSVRGTNWEAALVDQCSLIWNEANIIAEAEFPTGYKALFLVHGTSCAFMGYPNFLQIDWINSIMSWMDKTKNGCIAPDTKSGNGDPMYDHIAENGELCAHWETMMGTQLLITHLRYILETCTQDITQN